MYHVPNRDQKSHKGSLGLPFMLPLQHHKNSHRKKLAKQRLIFIDLQNEPNDKKRYEDGRENK